MIQAIIRKGKVSCEQVPAPVVSDGSVLIKVVNSCISPGTEGGAVAGSGKSLIKRALEQPDKVKQAFAMFRSEGIAKTYAKIRGKLEAGHTTGYSLSGVVIGVGEGVRGFKPGDHVAAAGAGLANHAEYVDVPENLVMKMPKGLSFVEASTVTLGGIALQGVRRADLRLGEICAVFGTGILGLLTVQLLRLSGVRVIAIDPDAKRLALAKESGAETVINPQEEDIIKTVENITGGYGVDGVLFTAAARSSEPLSQSFKICKKKGRVVLVGVVGMEIDRNDMYPKELDLLISTSYGPGRYDDTYEKKGRDYPYAYVRWTENRNMAEYLRLVQSGAIKLERALTVIYPISNVSGAFAALKDKANKPLTVILDYGEPDYDNLDGYVKHDRKVLLSPPVRVVDKELINIGLIGAGGFAEAVHLPNIGRLGKKYRLYGVVDRTGHKAKAVAERYNAAYATTEYKDIIADKNIDLIFITTRHDSHAELTLKALEAGKHVFVEKPLAVTREELERIKSFYGDVGGVPVQPLVMVGFNRRFSRYAVEIKKHTDKRINPLFIHYRMNAGYIPLDHWVHGAGGRIVGEAIHIVDLMTFFTGSKIESAGYEELSPTTGKFSSGDNKSIILKYEDGSVCTIAYFAVGSKTFPKEYMEIHFDEKTIVLDDYKRLKGYGVNVKEISTSTSEKGHLEELEALYNALNGKEKHWPIDLWDIVQSHNVAATTWARGACTLLGADVGWD